MTGGEPDGDSLDSRARIARIFADRHKAVDDYYKAVRDARVLPSEEPSAEDERRLRELYDKRGIQLHVVYCRRHGTALGVIWATPKGPLYFGQRPFLPRRKPPMLRAPVKDGRRQMAFSSLADKRASGDSGYWPVWMQDVMLLLPDRAADRRYADSPEHRGSVPVWCVKCDDERWVAVDLLRETVNSNRKREPLIV